jgi:hypothetical protein
MKSILITCLFLSTLMAACQVHWSQTADWKMYSYQGYLVLRLPVDSLNQYKTLQLNQDSITRYVTSAKPLDSKTPLVWMGGYIATCTLNGTVRKVDLSSYGGYFYDEKTNSYYQMPTEQIDAWLSFLKSSYMTLVTTDRQ